QTVRSYDIPAGSLADAINSFGEQSGAQILYDAALTQGRSSAWLKGQFGVAEGLSRLLAGSGVTFRQTSPNIFTLEPAPQSADGAIRLGPVRVEGEGASAGAYIPPQADIGDLPPAYAGGQVARGARVGMLGNKDVLDTPFNQLSFTSKLIEDQQAQALEDVLINSPSIAMNRSTSGGNDSGFTMRGFTPGSLSGGFSLNGLTGILPANVVGVSWAERVEVLQGPSALINGMPTTEAIGGTVNIVSKRAQDVPNASVTARFASPSQFGGMIDVGQRFGKNKQFGIRFNGNYADGGLPAKPSTAKHVSGVIGLDWRGNGARVSIDAGRQVYKTDALQRNLRINADVPLPQTLGDGPNYLAPWTYWNNYSTFGMVRGDLDLTSDITAYAAFGMNRSHSKALITNANLINAQGDWLVASAGLYDTINTTKSGVLGLRAKFDTGPVSHAVTLNAALINVLSKSAPTVTSTIGVVGNLYAPAVVIPEPDPDLVASDPRKSSDNDRSSFGIADTMSMLDERIQLTVGVRRQSVKSKSFNTTTGLQTAEYASDAWSPGVALVVKPHDNVSIYANAVQGLQPGTVVSTSYANVGEILPPYKSTQYEAGIKVDWDQALMTTVSLFQITQPSAISIAGTPLPTYALDGEQRNRGIELNMFGEPVSGVRLTGGLMAIDARLLKTAGGANDGNRAAGIPRLQGTLGAEWDLPFVPGLTLTSRLLYGGKTYIDAANTRTAASWTQVDLGARYTLNSPWNDKPIVVRMNVVNAFDRNYWVGRSGAMYLAIPRNVTLSATYNF
ncbi:MAG: TonB-dependent receptor, partial [Sphingobium sp.]